MNEMINRMNLEGIQPTAALASTLNERAQTLRHDLQQSRATRADRSQAKPWRKEAFDPTPFYLIARPQQV
jgi:hypothetical protein